MAELLLELLSEEIPARMQARAAQDLKTAILDSLKKSEISFETAEAHVTPRRICIVVDGLPFAQEDQSEERRGPKADAPEKAIEGFLRSTGLTRADCEERETPKGTFLFALIERKGQQTTDVLPALLTETLGRYSWPKSMRWGSGDGRWVRPLRSILALFDGDVIPFSFAGIDSSNQSAGHRFHAPESFEVSGYADYREKLADRKVILNRDERREEILKQAQSLVGDAGYSLNEDPGLLDEVTGLVEWPVAIMGEIAPRFMDLPSEVLVSSMKSHQKYLSASTADGDLAPCFITISNLEAKDGGRQIRAGNQYVLTARLSDAEFFYQTDGKKRLEERIPDLDRVVYHAKLGTVGEKATRISNLAAEIAEQIGNADPALAKRAGQLAKADLVSEMVGEFPELQGLMGRYYATNDGEAAEIADAIAAHYSPAGPNDQCPASPVSIAVALADKLDTLAGFWSIDETPTGSKDPFALRRAALGVIRLVLENNLRVGLRDLFHRALVQYEADENLAEALLVFFADRLKVYYRDQGRRHDLIASIFALDGEDDLVRLRERLSALSDFLATENGANLLTAYKRAANILRIEEKKDGQSYNVAVDQSLLQQDEEKALDSSLERAVVSAEQSIAGEDFVAAMSALAELRPKLDGFFDKVTVNAEDAALRANRLALLSRIRTTLHTVADFSVVEG